ANWNVVNTLSDTVGLTSSAPNPVLPVNTALPAGTVALSVTFKTATASGWTLHATDIPDGTKTAYTSPAIQVNAGAFAKLQLLAPGETAAPGTTAGKTGTPSTQTAGASFNVTVNAVDSNWNKINTNDTIAIASSDTNASLPANAALVNGTNSLSVTLKTAGSATLTASDVTHSGVSSNSSPSISVAAGGFVKLQILLPGQTAAPGSATGKTGTPTAQTAGTAFN